jgi:phosphoribosylaminoimidazolecarboxamide formyltransferase/IMP cyclohydrolase
MIESIIDSYKFKLLTETSLSYNNFCDRDKVLQTTTHIAAGFELNFGERAPFIAIAVKHGNACGVGLGAKPIDVLMKMIEGDVKAIHGGSIFTNFKIDEEEAEMLIHYSMKKDMRRLLDTVTAPDFSNVAIEILARKKGKCRIVSNINLANISINDVDKVERTRFIRNGFATQPNYTFIPDFKEANVEGDKDILNKENIISDLILSWAIGSTSNSNTITIVRDGKLLGNGVGQQDRVGAAKLAISRADDAAASLYESNTKANLSNAIAYSDSFFPFSDGPKVLTERGIKIIFATSGSVNDKDVIESSRLDGATLVMFPDKTARGFAWH